MADEVNADSSGQTPGAQAATPPATGKAPSAVDKSIAELQQRIAKEMEAHPGRSGETTTGSPVTGKSQWTPQLAINMGAGIFLFGVLFFGMISLLIWKNKSVDNLLRIFGILLIIVASVFLVIVGYSDQQIAPVMGLMGTIAGYLLSRRVEPAPGSGDNAPNSSDPSKPDDTKPGPTG
jgi:hypothetical protein